MTDDDLERIANEPANKVLTSKDLVDALLIKIEGVRDHEYWSLRVQLLINELGYSRTYKSKGGLSFKSSLDLLSRTIRKWGLPYEGALEVPPSPDFFAQSWVQENFAKDIANVKREITRIHREMFTKFFELWREQLEIQDVTTTIATLISKGLPDSEPNPSSGFDDDL
jgi:hypothetical protein